MDGNNRNKPTADGRRAGNFFAVRIAVAAYLVYLGFDLFRDFLAGASTLSPAVAWLCGPGFMAAGLIFAFYSWRRYRRENAAAGKSGESSETGGTSDEENP